MRPLTEVPWPWTAAEILIAVACYLIAGAVVRIAGGRPVPPAGLRLPVVFLIVVGTAHLAAAWSVAVEGLTKALAALLAVAVAAGMLRRFPRAPERGTRELRPNREFEQFTYAASHDLQEPLRMVTNYLQLLKRRVGHQLDGDAQEFLNYAVDGATRMRDLIQDLLRLSRAGTQELAWRAVSGEELLETATLGLRASLEESGAVVTADELPVVMADGGLLSQVLQNLIANAIKFRHPGVPPRIHLSACRQGGNWVFSVADNGIGIDPRHSRRIFQMFERLHGPEEYPGSGVGLAISRRIMERHGGRIWVESKPGQGSTFYLSFPANVSRVMAASA